MWNASLNKVSVDSQVEGVAIITIEYTHPDGRTKTVEERISEPNSIKKIASDAIKELNRIDSIKEFISSPLLGEITLVQSAPTEEELNKQVYSAKRQLLTIAKQDLDLGIIIQEDYDTLLAETISLKP